MRRLCLWQPIWATEGSASQSEQVLLWSGGEMRDLPPSEDCAAPFSRGFITRRFAEGHTSLFYERKTVMSSLESSNSHRLSEEFSFPSLLSATATTPDACSRPRRTSSAQETQQQQQRRRPIEATACHRVLIICFRSSVSTVFLLNLVIVAGHNTRQFWGRKLNSPRFRHL